ncbi:MAG: hypothetical protein JO069_05925 [Verrucomicrobia bacterium]|nr:hypothetical protein [Verrucomicrobiota bacterium]
MRPSPYYPVDLESNRTGDRILACLAWILRGCSVAFAVLMPALAGPEKDVWLTAGMAGFGVAVSQGLLVLIGHTREARTVRAASAAISAMLQDRINNDLAVILASVSSHRVPGSPPLAETVNRRVLNISGQLRNISAEAVNRWQERSYASAGPLRRADGGQR